MILQVILLLAFTLTLWFKQRFASHAEWGREMAAQELLDQFARNNCIYPLGWNRVDTETRQSILNVFY